MEQHALMCCEPFDKAATIEVMDPYDTRQDMHSSVRYPIM
jgi:hypothetical protein